MAFLTLNIGNFGVTSDIAWIAAIQNVLMDSNMPGIFAAMFLSRNVHAFFFLAAPWINGLVYFCAGWLVGRMFARPLATRS